MFKENFVIKGELVCETGLHIGGSNDNIDIGGTDNVIIRDVVSDLPFIPGSSLKGKLRSLFELNDKESAQSVRKNEGGPATDGDSKAAKIFGVSADKDKAYLIKQFKMHNLKEIHLELGRLLWDLMSDEEQKEYKKAVIQDIPVDEFIKSVYSYLNYGDFETALKELEDYMEIIPFKFRENPQFDYFYFNNPLEEELFRKYFKTPKELKVIPFGEEYPRVFYLYGVVLMNLSEFDRAESALKKALSYNPVSGEILSTLSALYDGNYDLNNLKKTAVEILKFSYDPREIAKAYRDLGYCYYENKKCNISKALYEQSLNYENHPRAQIELQLINSYLHIDETDIKKVLNDENIPANINDDILEISRFLALDFEKKNLLNQSLYFYGVLYNLTHDEEVLTKINDLKHRL